MNKDTFIMRTKIIEGGEGVAQEILDVKPRFHFIYLFIEKGLFFLGNV